MLYKSLSKSKIIVHNSLVLNKTAKNLIQFNHFKFTNKINYKEEEESNVDTQTLKHQLDTEIQSSESNYEEISQSDKEKFLSENRWVLFDKEGSRNMELRKSTGDMDISVKFSSKAPEMSESEQDSQNFDRFLDFYVSIKRNNTSAGLFIEAVTIDSSLTINQIHFAENIDKYSEDFLSARVVDGYTGPEFKVLDERLQQEFLDLFVSLGINDELGSFVEVLSLDKDERLNINWLKSVRNSLV